jgi:hypothetical protein
MASLDVWHFHRWRSRFLDPRGVSAWFLPAVQACSKRCHVFVISLLAGENHQIDASDDNPHPWESQHNSGLAPDGAFDRRLAVSMSLIAMLRQQSAFGEP